MCFINLYSLSNGVQIFDIPGGVYSDLGDTFLENLQGLTTSKIYRADERKAAEMDVEASHFRKITMRVLTMQLFSTTVMDILAYGGAAYGNYDFPQTLQCNRV